MAHDSNDTQSKINEEDREIQQRQDGSSGERGHDYQRGSSGMPGGYEGNNPGAQGGSMSGTTDSQVTGTPTAQGAGSVGSIGGEIADSDYSDETGSSDRNSGQSQASTTAQSEPLGAGHQQSADGGSVTFAGSSSTGPGPGQAGTDRDSGFIGSASKNQDDPQQAGFAEQGRGAPLGEGSNFEGSGERTANSDSDIEGSSKS